MGLQSKSNRELRKFGFTMAVAFALVSGLFFWREVEAWRYTAAIAGIFALGGALLPRILAPVEWAWMKLAHYLGTVMTFVLLTLTFFLLITPLGVIMRLFRADLLALKFNPQIESYWVKVDPEGPVSRPGKPY